MCKNCIKKYLATSVEAQIKETGQNIAEQDESLDKRDKSGFSRNRELP